MRFKSNKQERKHKSVAKAKPPKHQPPPKRGKAIVRRADTE